MNLNNEVARSKSVLDEILDTPEAAKWLKVTPRVLLAESQGEQAKIPAFWINQRIVRYYPRIILAKLSLDAGVSPELIAAVLSKPVFPVMPPSIRSEEIVDPNKVSLP